MKKAKLHSNTTGTSNGDIFVLSSVNEGDMYASIGTLILVEKCSRASLTVEVSLDQITWYTLKITSMHSGNIYDRMTAPGTYLAKTAGWEYLRVPVITQSGGSVTVTVNGMAHEPQITAIDSLRRVNKRPVYSATTPTTINTGQTVFSVGKTEGVIYASTANGVRKSTDWGVNWTTVVDYTSLGVNAGLFKKVEILSNGSLLAFLSDGRVYKSDTSETNFALVLTMTTAGASASISFGFSAYENIVTVCEYGGANPPDNAKCVYLSKDYGATWATIFAGPTDLGTWHAHSVAYDPYDGLLWLVNGDGVVSANVRWSNDFGTTWHKVYEDGECPTQWTEIIVLPNCVLLTTDNKDWGVWRWDRPITGIGSNKKVVFEQAFTLDATYAGSEPMGTAAAVTYGSNAVAYFGFSYFANNTLYPARVWATTNGYDFYVIWTAPKAMSGSSGAVGIIRVAGPSVNGNLALTYYSSDGDPQISYLIKVPAPTWV